MSFIKLSSIFCFLFLIFFTTSVLADDVLIIHQNYGNTHSKHKNRLENAGHTVTMQNTSSSYSYTASNYDQVYDIRYSYSSYSTADKDRFKTVLSNGGTVYLVGENGNFDARNDGIVAFLQEVTGDNNISHSGQSCCGSGSGYSMDENRDIMTSYSSSDDMTVVASGYFDNIGTNGKWLIRDPSNTSKVVGALWDGDAMSSYANGKVIVVLDINYASHSSYYNSGDQAWIDSLQSDVAVSTATTRSASSVAITSSQSTIKSTATSRTYSTNTIRITQSGGNLDLDIIQKGDNNFIEGSDFSSVATLTGDNLDITLEQGSSLGASNNNGIGLDVDGDANTVMIRQGTMGNSDTGGHKAKVNVTGDTNSLTLYQYNDGSNTSSHFSHIDITGGQNTVTSYQRNNNSKDLFIDLDGSSNTISTDQKETGNHYLDLDINGNGHTVTATQRGSGDHGARIDLTNSGGSSTVTLDQNSSTDQNYTLTQDCTNSSGCSTSVTQN